LCIKYSLLLHAATADNDDDHDDDDVNIVSRSDAGPKDIGKKRR